MIERTIMRTAGLGIFIIFSNACSSIQSNNDWVGLHTALDTKPDGFVLAGPSYEYKISKTFTNGYKLCRTVEIRRPGVYEVESFCKLKGGKWR